MAFKLFKKQAPTGGGAEVVAAEVVTATPVTAMPTSTTGVATEISALKRLMDQGILTKDEYEKGKANVLAPAASHATTNSTPSAPPSSSKDVEPSVECCCAGW
eukprot:CAMPEP_0113629554 /NCGR_PEP_ID=MMETSP0017_2-20120614/15343_1 /TAXON_ID=2856 /ORGANISM="Cylindrotheca closterium" /LENGTH=102 /DNA_ID=CAMNT_0000539959 /DNA_START=641 /DNA_END=946 /DNA_ORIENTATION=- /assembly_acc=CAM_ASM_000147